MANSSMHYMMRAIQALGWGNDYNVFLINKFMNDFYLSKNSLIPTNRILGVQFLKNEISNYIDSTRNPKSIFKTKLITKLTEENLNNGNKVSLIETAFLKYLTQFQNNPSSPLTNAVLQYFALQMARGMDQTSSYLELYLKTNSSILNQNDADQFKNLYNQEFKKFFDYFKDFYTYKNPVSKDICIYRTQIKSPVLQSTNLVLLSEFNCVNLELFNYKMNGLLHKYGDIIKDIDVAAISGNYLYFLVLDHSNKDSSIIKEVIDIVCRTWNDFSIKEAVEFLIIPSSNDFLDYLSNLFFDWHTSGFLFINHNLKSNSLNLIALEKYF